MSKAYNFHLQFTGYILLSLKMVLPPPTAIQYGMFNKNVTIATQLFTAILNKEPLEN